ncbi:MAG: NADH-ubiquinone oxidoreductase-F iron-sulfur binding region domain-containing protein [Bellilinea sp.]
MPNPKSQKKPVSPEILEIAGHYGRDPKAVLEVLRELDSRHGGLTTEEITDTAHALQLPANHAFGVASFYSMLSLQPRKNVLRVCDGPVCWLKRASETRHAFDSVLSADPEWAVERTSCLGLCDRAPAVLVNQEQAGPVAPPDAEKVCQGWRGIPTDYSQSRPGEVRVMKANAGKIDPDSIQSALEHGGYKGLQSALTLSPEGVLGEVEASGLAGRGGAGFPVGRKWRFVAQAERTPKYILCNADESEPLIFKDRVLMDTNPHQLLEGMAIAGYACGANEGFIYIRGEYTGQAERLERAIHQAEESNWLGNDIQGSGYSFHVHVHLGAGAYICGEETALIESLEGKRGEPRLRPPYPPTFGYMGYPSLVNNVESFSAVPAILSNGAAWYKGISNYAAAGTKLYMILGHVNKPGLFEAPFGLTLRQVIDEFGGGMLTGSTFKFALTGGAAGTIVPPSLLDIPMDYASGQKGVGLGAGAFLICDQSVSVVAFLREELRFFAAESCGKCTPCRVGTYRSFEILSRMAEGKGQPGDVAELRSLSKVMFDSSFCGLGQSVPIPMNSALSHFEDEFTAAEG